MIWNMFWEFECIKECLRSQHQLLFFSTSMTESPGMNTFMDSPTIFPHLNQA